jgi:flavin reductase (DIM6/NTAB) family NADH-FMN oxidoreductase RutF
MRGAMRDFATGVGIATTYRDRAGGRRHDAVTVNSLTSVSLHPPLVSLCLRRSSAFLSDLLQTKKWAVSILDGCAESLAQSLARDRAARVTTVDTLRAVPGRHTGALVLGGASWLECVLWDSFDIGDHTMVVGEVVSAGVRPRGPRLIFLHSRYHVLGDSSPVDVPADAVIPTDKE